jgi:gliding motility-associated-like protein
VPGVIAIDNVLLEAIQIQTPAQVCLQNGSAGLSYIYQGKSCDYSLVWQKDGVNIGTDSVLQVNAPGIYKLILDFACVKVEKTIRVNAAVASDTTLSVCSGGGVQINGRYITRDSDVRDTFQMPGGCDSIVLYHVRFRKGLNPFPDQKFFFCENGYDSIALRAGNASAYKWLPGGETTQTKFADRAGTYRVVMRDSLGCADTASLELISSCIPPYYIPNAFTPNGDGRNDVFLPYIMGSESFRLQVFNRWGEMLYDSFETGAGWDGYYKQILCQQSAYLYLVSFVTRSSKVTYNLSGTITLLR